MADDLADRSRGLVERRLRVGVTGLSGAGKTVFVTALIHALLHPRYLNGLPAVRDRRYRAAVLRPQPHQHLPRFPYEQSVAQLTGARGQPQWPHSTRRMAELRLSIRYRPAGLAGRLGERILHLDLFDYPGEWLLDLALLDYDYAQWSGKVLAALQAPEQREQAAGFLDYVEGLDPDAPDPQAEAKAMEAAARFRAYLSDYRNAEGRTGLLQPGRFLLPGDLEGSPLLTFAPLPAPSSRKRGRAPARSLRRMMEDRYRSYLDKVVRPFHSEHFARLDRQIVLVDLLGHLAGGAAGMARLDQELDAVQQALRVGSGWLPRLIQPRIERVLFAASKADHLPSDQHDALTGLLQRAVANSLRRTAFQGAETETMALASVRATREVSVANRPGRRYLAGQPLGAAEELAHYPGTLPTLEAIAVANAEQAAEALFEATAFRPPQGLTADGAWPHLRLDRALDFLIGDRLA